MGRLFASNRFKTLQEEESLLERQKDACKEKNSRQEKKEEITKRQKMPRYQNRFLVAGLSFWLRILRLLRIAH